MNGAASADNREKTMLKSLISAAALAAVLAFPGAGRVGAEPFRLIVTDLEVPLVPNSVMELADLEGYYERAGVDVELVRVQQTPLAMAALRSGEGEMANVALEALLQATAQGATDLRGVMSPNKSLPFLIAGRGDIDAVADLAGKRFGIGRIGSVDHLLSMKVLEAAGVDTSALELIGARPAAGPRPGAPRRPDRRDDHGHRHLHRHRRRPGGRDPRRRRRLLPRRADPLEAQRRAHRYPRRARRRRSRR